MTTLCVYVSDFVAFCTLCELFVTSAEGKRLCLYLCLSVCPLSYSKSYEQILMEFLEGVWPGPSNDGLDFGGISVIIQIWGFFEEFCIYIS